jgi:hypothetical protein
MALRGGWLCTIASGSICRPGVGGVLRMGAAPHDLCVLQTSVEAKCCGIVPSPQCRRLKVINASMSCQVLKSNGYGGW